MIAIGLKNLWYECSNILYALYYIFERSLHFRCFYSYMVEAEPKYINGVFEVYSIVLAAREKRPP
jgi:hypothetical protein